MQYNKIYYILQRKHGTKKIRKTIDINVILENQMVECNVNYEII